MISRQYLYRGRIKEVIGGTGKGRNDQSPLHNFASALCHRQFISQKAFNFSSRWRNVFLSVLHFFTLAMPQIHISRPRLMSKTVHFKKLTTSARPKIIYNVPANSGWCVYGLHGPADLRNTCTPRIHSIRHPSYKDPTATSLAGTPWALRDP